MAPLTSLISCGIIEKDTSGDILWAWTYPSIEDSQKTKILQKYSAQYQDNNNPSFVFFKHDHHWVYICNSEIAESLDTLPEVKHFSVVVMTKDYFPERYRAVSKTFSKLYYKTGSPVEVLRHFLSIFTNRIQKTENSGEFLDYNRIEPIFNIKEMIKTFELEIILIYTAILLKKRIIVYHHSLEELLEWIKAFPALMKHRKITECLYPWIDFSEDEIKELEKRSYYIVGCRKMMSSIRPVMYDVFVNLPAREIFIPPHAKESLTMTKTHKEIALFMVQLSDNQNITESQVICEIADKTRDLLNQLINLSSSESAEGKRSISIQNIKEKKLSTALENFLINLAVAENLVTI